MIAGKHGGMCNMMSCPKGTFKGYAIKGFNEMEKYQPCAQTIILYTQILADDGDKVDPKIVKIVNQLLFIVNQLLLQ